MAAVKRRRITSTGPQGMDKYSKVIKKYIGLSLCLMENMRGTARKKQRILKIGLNNGWRKRGNLDTIMFLVLHIFIRYNKNLE